MTPVAAAHLIAGVERGDSGHDFTAVSPYTGQPIGPSFPEATAADTEAAVGAAAAAAASLRSAEPDVLADLLDAIARHLENGEDEIVATADEETAIGRPRLQGELARTAGQLRLIAAWVRSGEHLEATIDHADASASPPRPDLRRMLIPLGPVAIFGASNFPLAFGVAGGDTASALGAGCPVIAKAHPAHPATSELAGRAICAAVSEQRLPPGTFSLLHGSTHSAGQALVTHPELAAVGFTGSLAGGRALFDLAARRPSPIPVYAEMGSVNPLLVTRAALRERGDAIAEGLGASLLLGTGQFCTSPGVVFAPAGPEGDEFVAALIGWLRQGSIGQMLSRGVLEGLRTRVTETRARSGVELLHEGPVDVGEGLRHPIVVLSTTASSVAADRALLEEHFGPVSLVVRYTDDDDLLPALRAIEGTLTFTVHAGAAEAGALLPVQDLMIERTGRVIWNGYPTGVAVAPAMHHGGPYPATTSALHTSVGTTAVRRFQRPAAYQDVPPELLPSALHEDNPLRIPRRVDGRLVM
jgi:NADP-dependent aldehyde dehydrogenase